MQNKDWFQAGEDILKSVVSAVESQDFSGLSKNIETKINTTINHINDKLTNSGNIHYGHNNMKSSTNRKDKYDNYNKASETPGPNGYSIVQANKQLPALYAKKPPGTYAGPVLKVLGIVGTSITGVAAFVLTLVGLFTGSLGVWIADAIVGGGLLGSVGVMKKGMSLEKMVARFKKYVKRIGEAQYCELEQLAGVVGKKIGFVKKDIRKMIDKGYFLQGHLDDKGTTVITSDDMYQHYIEAEQSRKLREIETAKQETPLLEEKETAYSAEVQAVLDEGEEYIRHIRECNEAIPGEEISQKLANLEDIMARIFEQVKKNPDNVADVQKMMKYYLPSTRKLIDTYRELDGQPSFGENNVANTKKEIENTLDVINAAFGKLFDDMFEDAAWDISAEISTMKTLLAKEGLTGGNDFDVN